MTVLQQNLNTPVRADAAIPSEWLFDTTAATEADTKETDAETAAAEPSQTVSATAAPASPVNTGSGFPVGTLLLILLLSVAAVTVLTVVLTARHKKQAAERAAAPAVRGDRTDSHE